MRSRTAMRSGVSLAAVAGLVFALLGPVGAQESEPPLPDPLEPVPRDEVSASFPIDDGTYTGRVGLGGSFWFSQEGVTVVWRGGGVGPLEVTVSDGELAGTWSMDGSADINGLGLPFEMVGINTWTSTGTVTGSDPYLMEGSGSGMSSVTVAGRTSDTDYSFPVASIPWQGVMQVCGQVLGNWDQAIDAAMEGAPLQYSMRSYFSLFSTDYTTDLDDQIGDLIEEATRLQQDMSVEETLLLGDLAVLLLKAEDLMGQVGEQPESCPADPSFMRIITQVVGDVMNTFLGKWASDEPGSFQMVALRRLVEVGLRAGAIGAGAADRGTASFIQAQAEQVLQRQFDFVAAQDPMSDHDLTTIATSATLLGYTFESGITGRDLCLVLGSC